MRNPPNTNTPFSRDPKGSAIYRLALSRKRLTKWLASAVVVVGLGVGLAIWFWPRLPLEPPLPDLAEVDPEVAEAISMARDKVRQQPNKSAAWGRLGMILLAHDFHEEAHPSLAEAERLDPADARWPYLRGLSLTRTDPDAGIVCLVRAAELCGNDPLAPRLRLADTFLNQGRLDEAAFHLEWARKRAPDNARVQLGLGRIAVLRGQWRTALEHLGPCTNDVHTRQLAHTLRAEVWTRLGEADKASLDQREAEQAPRDQLWSDPFLEDVFRLQCGLSVHLQRANELAMQRQYQQAVELLEVTARRYPQSIPLWLLLGDIWRQHGRTDRAEEAFAEAVRIDPDSPDGWYRLGCAQAAQGHARRAANSLRRSIRLKADHADAYVELGHCLKKMGDASAAADAFRAALRCRPDNERARQALREMSEKN